MSEKTMEQCGLRRKKKKILWSEITGLRKLWGRTADSLRTVKAADRKQKLAECQKSAISIGSSIERSLGGGRLKPVVLLEQFCEIMYQLSLTGCDEEGLIREAEKSLNELEYQFGEIEEMPLEVVFFPYKAAMWDSLDSIWRAADADPECNAYVVPIPYYDVLPDRSDVRLNYEGDLFPEDVPVTPWQDYSLKDHCPDIVFVHNPFDDQNRVTTVKPDYFSANLKQYTDMLVYVPYFLTGGEIPDIHVYLSSYKNFDKIIVQNEKFANTMRRYIPEEKLAVLGSPKCDRVLECCRAPRMPEEWGEKLEGKKVIFFNLSISRLLGERTEAYLEKIERFFDLVSEYENLAVIWRPHPLLNTTMNSMRKNLRKRIDALDKQFMSGKIGVRDTTPDINNAIALSDAYVGESSSSVVPAFGIAGKPIFILSDTDFDKWEERREVVELTFFCPDAEQRKVYFVSIRHRALCSMDLDTGHTEVLAVLDVGEQYTKTCLVRKNGDRLYIGSLYDDHIFVFELKAKTGHFFALPPGERAESAEEACGEMRYLDFSIYEDALYVIPAWCTQIIKIDLSSERMEESYQISEDKGDTGRKRKIAGSSPITENGKLYLCAGRMLEVDLKNGQKRWFQEDCGEMAIFWNCGVYGVKPGGRNIYRWDMESEGLKEFGCLPEWYGVCGKGQPDGGKRMVYHSLCWLDDSEDIHVVPGNTNAFLKMNRETGEFKMWDWGLPFQIGERKNERFQSVLNFLDLVRVGKTEWMTFSYYDNSFIIYDEKHRQSRVLPCRLIKNDIRECLDWNRYFGESVQQGYWCREQVDESLGDFLEDLSDKEYKKSALQKQYYAKRMTNSGGNAGKQIYHYVKEQIR